MIRMIVVTLLSLGFWNSGPAQGIGDIFSQSAGILKAYVLQIAAMEKLIAVTGKGYHIVENGLADIGRINGDEYDLHGGYFSSLKQVKPLVSDLAGNFSKMIAIMNNKMDASLRGWKKADGLTGQELGYIENVYSFLKQEGQRDSRALEGLVTEGELSMSDGQRMLRMQGLINRAKNRYAGLLNFIHGTDVLIGQRLKERAVVGAMEDFVK